MSNNEPNSALSRALESQPLGQGLRPAFEALWHLKALRVVNSTKDFASDAWDIAKTKEGYPVVVVMDTPLDYGHPNLKANIDLALMRDFSVFNHGEFPVPYMGLDKEAKSRRDKLAGKFTIEAPENDATKEHKKDAKASHSGSEDQLSTSTPPAELGAKIAAEIQSEVKQAEVKQGDAVSVSLRPSQALVNQVPGAHGTAVAGLIAGTPGSKEVQSAALLAATSQPSSTKPVDLPYAGINPFATIVPISLTAAPYPDMVLGALTYIEAIAPDIIVIAAAWADGIALSGAQRGDETWQLELNDSDVDFTEMIASAPEDRTGAGIDPNAKTGGDERMAEDKKGQDAKPAPDTQLWDEVTAKLKALSSKSIVLCAAGNVDSDALVYPASLCALPDNGIWAVTACAENGDELSYAPPLKKGRRMIKTLSTQLPRADRKQTIVDPYEYRLPELKMDHAAPHNVEPRDIISLDPGGRQGYNPTEYPNPTGDAHGPLLEIGSLYTRFSGTSAATAIAGGLVSLALSVKGGAVETGTARGGVGLKPETLFDLDQAKALLASIP